MARKEENGFLRELGPRLRKKGRSRSRSRSSRSFVVRPLSPPPPRRRYSGMAAFSRKFISGNI